MKRTPLVMGFLYQAFRTPSVHACNVTQESHANTYVLNHSDTAALSKIEIAADLGSATFFINENTENPKELHRRRGLIAASTTFETRGVGSVSGDQSSVRIGMGRFSDMHKNDIKRIDQNIGIGDALHPLELILIKARNSGVISPMAYRKIRMDVRNRVRQLEDVTEQEKQVYQNFCKQWFQSDRLSHLPFQRIRSEKDLKKFSTEIVAYTCSTPNYSSKFTHPLDQKIYFAKIGSAALGRQGREAYFSDMHSMDLLSSVRWTKSLSDSQISVDKTLSMRLATMHERLFLEAAITLNQASLGYPYHKKSDAIREVSTPYYSLDQDGQVNAIIPPPFSTGPNHIENVDWDETQEHALEAGIVPPCKAYIIKGGTAKSRDEKYSYLVREDVRNLHSMYSNDDNTELAVVFSQQHGTYYLMDFDIAKKIVEEQCLSDNNTEYGMIDLNLELQHSRKNRF